MTFENGVNSAGGQDVETESESVNSTKESVEESPYCPDLDVKNQGSWLTYL